MEHRDDTMGTQAELDEAVTRFVADLMATVRRIAFEAVCQALEGVAPASPAAASGRGRPRPSRPASASRSATIALERLLRCGAWPEAMRASALVTRDPPGLPPGTHEALRALVGAAPLMARALGNALRHLQDRRIEGIPLTVTRTFDGHGYAIWQVIEVGGEASRSAEARKPAVAPPAPAPVVVRRVPPKKRRTPRTKPPRVEAREPVPARTWVKVRRPARERPASAPEAAGAAAAQVPEAAAPSAGAPTASARSPCTGS